MARLQRHAKRGQQTASSRARPSGECPIAGFGSQSIIDRFTLTSEERQVADSTALERPK